MISAPLALPSLNASATSLSAPVVSSPSRNGLPGAFAQQLDAAQADIAPDGTPPTSSGKPSGDPTSNPVAPTRAAPLGGKIGRPGGRTALSDSKASTSPTEGGQPDRAADGRSGVESGKTTPAAHLVSGAAPTRTRPTRSSGDAALDLLTDPGAEAAVDLPGSDRALLDAVEPDSHIDGEAQTAVALILLPPGGQPSLPAGGLPSVDGDWTPAVEAQGTVDLMVESGGPGLTEPPRPTPPVSSLDSPAAAALAGNGGGLAPSLLGPASASPLLQPDPLRAGAPAPAPASISGTHGGTGTLQPLRPAWAVDPGPVSLAQQQVDTAAAALGMAGGPRPLTADPQAEPGLTVLGDSNSPAMSPVPAGLPSFAAELARAVQPAPGAPLAPASAPRELTLSTPVTEPGFMPQLGGELAVLARDGVQEARINVHPVELGPISVQIALDGTSAQVHLAVDSAQTRELLEQAMPTLAAALRDTGLTLTGGGVFQQSRQAPQDPAAAEKTGPDRGRGQVDNEGPSALAATPRRLQPTGSLDVFA